MSYKLSKKSRDRLKHVHPDLVLVVALAIRNTSVDFSVLEGIRTKSRQKKLLESGASQVMNSRHLANSEGLCFAVDLGAYVGGRIDWSWPLYHEIAFAMKWAAKELDIEIEWGGDWQSFQDGPHFQLPRNKYS